MKIKNREMKYLSEVFIADLQYVLNIAMHSLIAHSGMLKSKSPLLLP